MEIIIKETLGKNVKAGEVKNWPMETLHAIADQSGRPIDSFAKPLSEDAKEHFKRMSLLAEKKKGR